MTTKLERCPRCGTKDKRDTSHCLPTAISTPHPWHNSPSPQKEGRLDMAIKLVKESWVADDLQQELSASSLRLNTPPSAPPEFTVGAAGSQALGGFEFSPAAEKQEAPEVQTVEQWACAAADELWEDAVRQIENHGMKVDPTTVKRLGRWATIITKHAASRLSASEKELERMRIVRDAVYMGLQMKNLSTAAMVELLEQVGAALSSEGQKG